MKDLNVNSKLKNISAIFLLLAVLASLVLISNDLNDDIEKFPHVLLNDGWNITVNGGKTSKNVNLKEYVLSESCKGDVIEMETTLPDTDITCPIVEMAVYHCVVSAYVDNDLIYEYGTRLNDEGLSVGSGLCLIELPADYAFKTIRIVLDVTEDEAFYTFENVQILSEENYASYFTRKNLIVIALGVFLITFGVMITIVMIANGNFDVTYRKFIWIGLVAITSGCWMLSNFMVFEVAVGNRHMITYFEYLGLQGLAMSSLMFCYETTRKKFLKNAMFTLFIIGFIIAGISVVTDLKGIMHVCAYLKIFHMYYGCVGIMAGMYIYYGLRSKQRAEKILAVSMLCISGLAVIELIKFNVQKFLLFKNTGNYILPLAVLLFLIIMVVSCMEYIKEHLNESINKKVLMELAYNDMLTGLNNRTKCEEVLSELRDKNEKKFSIICFDLNNLKFMNDNLGHAAGDAYLFGFARILKECFNGSAVVSRTGGDEFVVITRNDDEVKVTKKLTRLIDLANANVDENGEPFIISFAYGYAISTDANYISVDNAYKIADKRMYECKNKQKIMANKEMEEFVANENLLEVRESE